MLLIKYRFHHLYYVNYSILVVYLFIPSIIVFDIGSQQSMVYDLSDYENDMKDLQRHAQKLKEFNHQWNNIQILSDSDRSSPQRHDVVFIANTNDALKITEMKEEYLNRRKNLAKIVKSFTDLLNDSEVSWLFHIV